MGRKNQKTTFGNKFWNFGMRFSVIDRYWSGQEPYVVFWLLWGFVVAMGFLDAVGCCVMVVVCCVIVLLLC